MNSLRTARHLGGKAGGFREAEPIEVGTPASKSEEIGNYSCKGGRGIRRLDGIFSWNASAEGACDRILIFSGGTESRLACD